jgi:hypothetical protein
MKFTRRSFWKLAGTGIFAASMPKSARSDAEGKMPDYSFIPLTDVVDHLDSCFSDHIPKLITPKSSRQQP